MDNCLQIQVDDEDASAAAKAVAERILQELDERQDLDAHELLAKKRRLERPDEESVADHSMPFPLTQELERLLDEESDHNGQDALNPPAPPPPPRLRSVWGQLDPRAGALRERVHATHKLRTFRGLIWCSACGYYSSYLGASVPHLRALAITCDLPKAKGVDNFRRLNSYPRKWPHPMKG